MASLQILTNSFRESPHSGQLSPRITGSFALFHIILFRLAGAIGRMTIPGVLGMNRLGIPSKEPPFKLSKSKRGHPANLTICPKPEIRDPPRKGPLPGLSLVLPRIGKLAIHF